MNETTLNVLQQCDGVPTERYRAGDTLVEEGHWSGKLFILVDGEVDVAQHRHGPVAAGHALQREERAHAEVPR